MIDLALDDRIFINEELDEFIQEIDVLFGTTRTELIGYPEYGSNFMDYLWDFKPDPQQLVEYTEALINTCKYADKFTVSVSSMILEGSYREVYELNIEIYYKEKLLQQKIYEFR